MIIVIGVPESKAVTVKGKRTRNGIVRKMKRKLMSGASWKGNSGKRRLHIRRLLQFGLSFTILSSVFRFQCAINLSIVVYVLYRG